MDPIEQILRDAHEQSQGTLEKSRDELSDGMFRMEPVTVSVDETEKTPGAQE